MLRSLPTRGVWIEIPILEPRILVLGHSPPGECGLKYYATFNPYPLPWSLPTRGVWIEIFADMMQIGKQIVTPHQGSVD